MSSPQKFILFPTDFSQAAQEAWSMAVLMARAYEAEIILLHVIEPPSGVVKLLAEYEDELAIRHARRLADEFIDSQSAEGISLRRMVKMGKAHRMIVEAAWELDPQMIVMGTLGASGFKEYLLGSNASRVIQSAPCPIISVREHPNKERIEEILLPLDLTEETKEKVGVGIQLAEIFDARLHLISVVTLPRKEEVYASLKNQLEKTSEQIRKKGVKVEASLLESEKPIGQTVLEYATQKKVDLLCIMTQQEKKFREYIMGSNASYVVNHANIPVMSIRPKQLFPAKRSGRVV